MKKALLLFFCFIFFEAYSQSIQINPQGTAESSYTPQQLVTNVFADGCSNVNNFFIQYGREAQNSPSDVSTPPTVFGDSFGYFTYSGTGFPIDEGIILSTGIAKESEGGNNSTGNTGYENPSFPWPGDSDLEEILNANFGNTAPTREATVFEFDFVPLTDQVSFDYVFASEEWNASNAGYECPNTQNYLDGFAFILTGPGVVPDTYDHDNNPGTAEIPFAHGGKNIALIPGTNIPVSAGTIYNNSICTPTQSYPNLHVLNPAPSASNNSPVEFNAMTTLLTASSTVVPGETYRIKLVVADRSDDSLDSAVFLRANSFSLGAVDLGSDLEVCDNDGVTLTAQGIFSSNAVYDWEYNGSNVQSGNSNTYNATNSGTYTVTVTDGPSGSCVVSDDVIVTLHPAPIVTAPASVTLCDSNYTLPALTSGNYFTGTGGAGTQLNAGDIITTTQTIYVYEETGTTPNCSDEESFTITINTTPNVDELPDISVCDNYILPTLTTGTYYTESGGLGTQLNAGEVVNTTQTVYIYAETGTTPNCSDEHSFEITIITSPNVDSIANVNVCNDYILSTLTTGAYYTGTGGTGAQLNAGDSITTTQTIYIYAETGTIPNCTDEKSFIVTINTLPDVDELPDVTVCDSYTLPTLTSGNYFTGPDGTGTQLSAGDTIDISQTIYIYAETGTTPNCSDEESFVVTIDDSPIIMLNGDTEICEGSSTILNVVVNETVTFEWYLNNGLINGATNDSLEVTEEGTYQVNVIYGTCIVTESLTVSFIDAPITLNLIDKEICPGEETLLDATPLEGLDGMSFLWNTGATTPSIIVNEVGIYTVTVSFNGCEVTGEVEVTNSENCIIPTGISPNGDDLNDSFDVAWLNAKRIKFYNRYGSKVYEKADYKDEWYGHTDDGDELPTGTYYYVIYVDGRSPITGWVYVNREE